MGVLKKHNSSLSLLLHRARKSPSTKIYNKEEKEIGRNRGRARLYTCFYQANMSKFRQLIKPKKVYECGGRFYEVRSHS
jgi:hypothetical protein